LSSQIWTAVPMNGLDYNPLEREFAEEHLPAWQVKKNGN
jgi:hypothetical protein